MPPALAFGRPVVLALAIMLPVVGCDGEADHPAQSTSAGDDGSATGAATTATSSTSTGTDTSATDAVATTEADVTSSSTSAAETTAGEGASTTGGACPIGTEGCSCGAGDACEGDLACREGFCLPAEACLQQTDAEPNDDEQNAVMLDSPGCAPEVLAFQGSVDATGSDWFRASTTNIGCTGVPRVIGIAPDGIELCIFYECLNGTFPNIPCEAGDEVTSPTGRHGCCGTGLTETGNITCLGAGTSGNDGTMYFEVRPTTSCVEYEIAARYY